MSKSRGNVVNPDDVVDEYGADSLRLYEMFMGPLEQVKPWQHEGRRGRLPLPRPRLARRLRAGPGTANGRFRRKVQDVACTDKALLKVVHETIKKVTEDIEKLSFNTAISQMMICTNAFTQAEVVPLQRVHPAAPRPQPLRPAPHRGDQRAALRERGTRPISVRIPPGRPTTSPPSSRTRSSSSSRSTASCATRSPSPRTPTRRPSKPPPRPPRRSTSTPTARPSARSSSSPAAWSTSSRTDPDSSASGREPLPSAVAAP